MGKTARFGGFSFALLLVATASLPTSRATIYQWEYIDPSNPSLGKQPSTTPTAGGANITAGPGVNFNNADLTLGYLIGANVSGARMANVKLTLADLTDANLTNAEAVVVTWTGATLTGATIRGAYLYEASTKGLTPAQFYSTGSYQTGDLTGIRFGPNNLSGWNLSGKNLTGAIFGGGYATTYLANADLSNANLTNANLEDVVMPNANFTNATLAYANFEDVTTTDANFTGADIRGATFSTDTASGFSAAQLYSTATYQSGDLSGITFGTSNLSGWNFAGKNLTDAFFSNVTLAGANFTNANIQGARFASGGVYGGISYAQFASTANYQARNLQGIRLSIISGSGAGWSFVGQNFTDVDLYLADTVSGVDFRNAIFTNSQLRGSANGAIFTGADVRGLDFNSGAALSAGQFYSTKNYQEQDLTGFNLSGKNLALWSFADQNLSNANFSGTFLFDAVFTGATIRGMNFTGAHDVTSAQIYSTASYQTGDLVGVKFGFDMVDWNFAGKDLTRTRFGTISLVNFQGARLVEGTFGTMAGVNFTAADTRGASNHIVSGTSTLTNTIRPNGRVEGLTLTQSKSLTVRNYAGLNGVLMPIQVGTQFTADSTGLLQIVLDEDAWGSTISFDAGIAVALGGTLQLDFAADVDVVSQMGRTILLFDWTGVTPTGAFAVSSYYLWDTSNLYTTGEVTLSGTHDTDFNGDDVVDGADFLLWQRTAGGPNFAREVASWKVNFGQAAGGPAAQVPEPLPCRWQQPCWR